jgi:hypothetical protein
MQKIVDTYNIYFQPLHVFPQIILCICWFDLNLRRNARYTKHKLFKTLDFTSTCFGYRNVAIFRELQYLNTYATCYIIVKC